jgi:hypothetical protein
MNPSFSPDTATGREVPQMAMIVRPSDAAWQQEAIQAVSDARGDLSELSDAELEQHIKDCGWLAELAMCRWAQSGDFSDRGEADYWRRKMEEAIKSRKPEYVAQLERERGLA